MIYFIDIINYQNTNNQMSTHKYEKQPNKNLLFRRSKTQNKCQQLTQQTSLQKIASMSLCQLSEGIGSQPLRYDSFRKNQQLGYSPWKMKIQLNESQQELMKLKKKMSLKGQIQKKKIRNQILSSQKIDEQHSTLKKNNSIFMRLKNAREMKDLFEVKSVQINDVMMNENLLLQNKAESKRIKSVLTQNNENCPQNAKSFIRKIQNVELIKKKSLNIMKKSPQLFEVDKEERENGQLKHTTQHWKARKISSKTKKCKESVKIAFNKKIDEKERTARAKKFFHLQKSYKEEYQSNNPLTRHLYERFLDTISISYPIKDYKFDFL